jgi:Fur family ferric uptake transcriptional regulator
MLSAVSTSSPGLPGSIGDDIVRALDAAGYRVTDSRRAVIDLICTRDGAFETADLVSDARRRKIEAARATIFRTLEILTGIGVVERLDLPNGDHSYVRCDSRAHHHHLVCTRCQRSIDLEDLGMTPILAQVARRTGYKIDRHRVELFGLCPACQKKALPAE